MSIDSLDIADPGERTAELERLLSTCECLISATQMQAVYDQMATVITHALRHRVPVVLAVMNGGLIAIGQLLSRLSFPLEVGYLHATSLSRRAASGGALKWLAQPDMALNGRDVLIIDDIFDEGFTLRAVRDGCIQAGAAKVWIAAWAKPNREMTF